jgi:MSHA biogenesis protein MshM
MYREHFGLREPPFGLTPDTTFTFACTSHQEALNVLLVAVATGEGFIKITGEVGMGKTLLCRRFLSTLTADQIAAYLPNPMLDPRGLLLALAEELHVPVDKNDDQHHLIKSLNHALLDFARAGHRVVVWSRVCLSIGGARRGLSRRGAGDSRRDAGGDPPAVEP